MTITSSLRFLYIFGGSGLLCAGQKFSKMPTFANLEFLHQVHTKISKISKLKQIAALANGALFLQPVSFPPACNNLA